MRVIYTPSDHIIHCQSLGEGSVTADPSQLATLHLPFLQGFLYLRAAGLLDGSQPVPIKPISGSPLDLPSYAPLLTE